MSSFQAKARIATHADKRSSTHTTYYGHCAKYSRWPDNAEIFSHCIRAQCQLRVAGSTVVSRSRVGRRSRFVLYRIVAARVHIYSHFVGSNVTLVAHILLSVPGWRSCVCGCVLFCVEHAQTHTYSTTHTRTQKNTNAVRRSHRIFFASHRHS